MEYQAQKAGRPMMPNSYGVDANQTGNLLTWDWVSQQATTARNYWVATTSSEGKPHAMPVWGVWLGDKFYFSTDPKSRKGRNLAANPQIVVHLESGDDVVIIEGITETIRDAELMNRIADDYAAKYDGIRTPTDPDSDGLYGVRPVQVYAWLEKDFPNTATRWRFE